MSDSDESSVIENPWDEEPEWIQDDNDDASGEDDRSSSGAVVHGAQHVMILVDCRPSMFVPSLPHENDTIISPMQASLLAVEEVLRNKVKNVAVLKTGKRDGVGVLLCVAEEEAQTLLPLEPPGVHQCRKIRNYAPVKNEEESSAIGLRRAIHQANKAFSDAKCVKNPTNSYKGDAKSVWIFSDNDDPGEEEKEHLERIAMDAVDNGVELHLWPLKENFQTEWWNTILTCPITEGKIDMEDLKASIHREWRKVRPAFSCPILLPDLKEGDSGIMVDFYKCIQVQRKPQATTIHQQTKKETEKVTQMVDGVTGEILQSSREKHVRSYRIRTYVEFGGTRVAIAPHEISELKRQSNLRQEASLVLLGFRENDAVPLHHTVDQSYFLFPNDERVTGSTVAFANLHASMIRKSVVAIGELLTRATATSRLVAVFPQVEVSDQGGLQVQPPGMVAVVLPFDDDVRGLDEDTGEATSESVDAGLNLIEHMMFDKEFELDLFKNDSLAHFWHYIESIALETTLPEPEESLKMVSDEDVRQAAGKEIDAFYASLSEDIEKPKALKKRKLVKDESACDWLDLYKTDSLCDCSIDELKQYLRSVGEKLVGKKADLIDRVAQSIGGRIANGEWQKSTKINHI